MDVDLPAEDDPRRREVRKWFEEHPEPPPRDLARAGYVVPHWPKPYGLDADPPLQLMNTSGVTIRKALARLPFTSPSTMSSNWSAIAPISSERKKRIRGEL